MNDASVIQSAPLRGGINIGDLNYFGNGNVGKNIIGTLNPTFEPMEQRNVYALSANGTGTTFTDPVDFDTLPTNYFVGAAFEVVAVQSGGAELGCIGTIASHTSPNFPNETNVSPVFTINAVTNQGSSGCAHAFQIGDVIDIKIKRTPTLEADWEGGLNGIWPQLSGGGKLTSDTTGLCATCGTQALKMDATSGTSQFFVAFDSGNPPPDVFVLINGTYQLSFWAKIDSGSPTLHVNANRSSTGGFSCSTFTPTLTGTWALYTSNCTASETQAGTSPGTAQITASATGGAVSIDNLVFQKTGTDPTNTTIWRDEVINTLKTLNPGFLRYWVTGQNGLSIDNWTQPDSSMGPASSGIRYYVQPGGTVQGQGQQFTSLYDYLKIVQTIGAQPYIEIPITWDAADMSNFIDFMAGDGSTTYGTRRINLGQTAPYTSIFSKIYLAICNECWNPLFVGEGLPFRSNAPGSTALYFDYFGAARPMLAGARANAFYDTSKFEIALNAQTAVNSGWDALISSAPAGQAPDGLEINSYYYGTVNDTSTDAIQWGPEFVIPWLRVADSSDPYNFYQSVHDYQSQTTCGPSGSSACHVSIYEWGQGTWDGSLSQTAEDQLNAGAGDAIPTAILPLLNTQFYGLGPQARFSLDEYSNSGVNSNTTKLWGAVVDMGGATNNVRPAFYAIQMVNSAVIGPMFSCSISGTGSTYNFAGNSSNGDPTTPAFNNVPAVYAFCFKNGNQRSMILVNADVSASHTLTFSGTVPSGSVTETLYEPSGPDLMNEAHTGSATNHTAAAVTTSTTTSTNPTSITLPTYSVVELQFSTLASPSHLSGKGIVAGKASIN